MTPLAQRLARDHLLPARRRLFVLEERFLDDIHCFECSAVVDAATILACAMKEDMIKQRDSIDLRVMFLPAPKTWLEFVPTLSLHHAFLQHTCMRAELDAATFCRRRGALLDDTGDGYARVFEVDAKMTDRPPEWDDRQRPVIAWETIPISNGSAGSVRLHGWEDDGERDKGIPGYSHDEDGRVWATTFMMFLLYAMLAIINTPNIVRQRRSCPHAGLARDLRRAGAAGFVLNDWHEVLLDVTPPGGFDGAGGGGCGGALHGARALHFVRSHLRVRLGRLEMVKSHWRGDASVGVGRAIYRLR